MFVMVINLQHQEHCRQIQQQGRLSMKGQMLPQILRQVQAFPRASEGLPDEVKNHSEYLKMPDVQSAARR